MLKLPHILNNNYTGCKQDLTCSLASQTQPYTLCGKPDYMQGDVRSETTH